MEKIFLIGCGKIGIHFLKGILNSSLIAPENLFVISNTKKKLLDLQKKYHFSITEKIITKPKDVIILATPPKAAREVLRKIELTSNSLIISIMAGVLIKNIVEIQPKAEVIRALPNLAIAINKGTIAYYSPKTVSTENKNLFLKIFQIFGKVIDILSEDKINSCTAVLGSGTGFIFYLMRAFLDSALELGLPKEIAKQIVVSNFINSASFVEQSKKSLDELILEVCTKGGTTEVGINILKTENIDKIVNKSLTKAYEKCNKLY